MRAGIPGLVCLKLQSDGSIEHLFKVLILHWFDFQNYLKGGLGGGLRSTQRTNQHDADDSGGGECRYTTGYHRFTASGLNVGTKPD